MATGVDGRVSGEQMTNIKAKVIDNFHLELERGLDTKSGEVLVKNIEKKPVKSLRGAWGYYVDSAEFVEKLRTP